jgi:hypothetical protein
MRNTIENWNGTDTDLLTELNHKQHKRVIGDGMVTLAMVGSLSVELAATVNLKLEIHLAKMPETNPIEMAQKSMLRRFLERFTVSDRGLDFSNDEVRAQLSQLLLMGGIPQEQITAMLSLGAVIESDADQALGRDAVQSDIDEVRAVIAREQLQADWGQLFAEAIQPALQTGTRAEVAAAIRAVADGMEGG